MKKTILIYNDFGVFDIRPLKKELQSYFSKTNVSIDTINSSEIINNSKLNNETLALFVPGGMANEYFKKLGTKGNINISNYVKNGGIYFGICGGAYYACQKVEFETDIPELKINTEYKLNLINTLAKGTLYKEFNIHPYSASPKSTIIIDIEDKATKTSQSAVYHGGPFFDLSRKDYKVIANYKLNSGKKLPAIIQKQYGKGQVILSGVHFEYNLENLETIKANINKTSLSLQLQKEIKAKENKRQTLFYKLMQKIR